jgi:hypothetical protein
VCHDPLRHDDSCDRRGLLLRQRLRLHRLHVRVRLRPLRLQRLRLRHARRLRGVIDAHARS